MFDPDQLIEQLTDRDVEAVTNLTFNGLIFATTTKGRNLYLVVQNDQLVLVPEEKMLTTKE